MVKGSGRRADGHETLVLLMLTGHGRATPLMGRTVPASARRGNQGRHEEELLRALRQAMRQGVKVTVVADRGFGNGPVIQCLEVLGFESVLRIRGDFSVTNTKGKQRRAWEWVGVKGRSRTLRRVRVTEAGRAARWCTCTPWPWCVVASGEKMATRTLIRYYAKRWGIDSCILGGFKYRVSPSTPRNRR